MYLGKVMELADRDSIYHHPRHPYTRALIESVPIPDPVAERKRARNSLGGELPSPANPPSGCVFRTRCPYAEPRCAEQKPSLYAISNEDEEKASVHKTACIRAKELFD